VQRTFKMTKLAGESSEGIEDAVRVALATSAKAVRGQSWAQVVDVRANLNEDASIDRWQVVVEIGFEVEEDA